MWILAKQKFKAKKITTTKLKQDSFLKTWMTFIFNTYSSNYFYFTPTNHPKPILKERKLYNFIDLLRMKVLLQFKVLWNSGFCQNYKQNLEEKYHLCK